MGLLNIVEKLRDEFITRYVTTMEKLSLESR
jgi:hypothetical protein